MDKKFIITKEQVDGVWDLLSQHKTIQARGILNNLEKYKEDTLRNELRRFIQNKGKSDILKSELWDLLDKTKIKLKEDKMAEDETQEEETGESGGEEKKEEETSEKTEEAEDTKEESNAEEETAEE